MKLPIVSKKSNVKRYKDRGYADHRAAMCNHKGQVYGSIETHMSILTVVDLNGTWTK